MIKLPLEENQRKQQVHEREQKQNTDRRGKGLSGKVLVMNRFQPGDVMLLESMKSTPQRCRHKQQGHQCDERKHSRIADILAAGYRAGFVQP